MSEVANFPSCFLYRPQRCRELATVGLYSAALTEYDNAVGLVTRHARSCEPEFSDRWREVKNQLLLEVLRGAGLCKKAP